MTPQYLMGSYTYLGGKRSAESVNTLPQKERKEIYAAMSVNPNTPSAEYNVGYLAGLRWSVSAASLEEMMYIAMEYAPYCIEYEQLGGLSDLPEMFGVGIVTDLLRSITGGKDSVPVTIEHLQMEYGLVSAVMDTYMSCLRAKVNTIKEQLSSLAPMSRTSRIHHPLRNRSYSGQLNHR